MTYLNILKLSASSPLVVNLSLYRLPCGVKSSRDILPSLPDKSKLPAKINLKQNASL